jgi:hypothetical protein
VSGFGVNNCTAELPPDDDRPEIRLNDTHRFISDHNCLFGNTNGPYNNVSSDTDIYRDPRFVDPEDGDFRLQPDSPCIGAATDGGNIGAY